MCYFDAYKGKSNYEKSFLGILVESDLNKQQTANNSFKNVLWHKNVLIPTKHIWKNIQSTHLFMFHLYDSFYR